MVITKTVQKIVEETSDVICNKCGVSLKDEYNFNGLVEAEVVGGYDSSVFADMSKYRFSLCETCLKELFDTFKHNAFIPEESY